MIFEDSSRIRWKRILRVSFIVTLTGMILLIDGLVMHMIVLQPIPDTGLYEKEYKANNIEQANLATYEINQDGESEADIAKNALENIPENPNQNEIIQRIRDIRILPFFPEKPFLQGAFIVQNDPQTGQILSTHAGQIDLAFPDWFNITGSSCRVNESINWDVAETLSRNKIPTLPRFSNMNGDSLWGGSEFARFIADKNQSQCLIDALKWNVKNRAAKGIDIDIIGLQPMNRDVYTEWLLSLIKSFHDDALLVAVSVNLNDAAFDYKNIARMSDAVVLKAYDEHNRFGKPGPITSDVWFERNLDITLKALSVKNLAKIIVAIGSYGYDWNITTNAVAENRSFDTILTLAKNVNATIRTDPKSKNNMFAYRSVDGSIHEVWFSDAASMLNQYLSIKKRQTQGVAFWQIGLSDPGIWNFASTNLVEQFNPRSLANLPNIHSTSFTGSGEIFKILQLPKDGMREVTSSGKNIESMRYDSLPQNLNISLFGKPQERTVALTFNNGPDKYTSSILDVLKKYGVQATFFLRGENIQQYPEIVQREYDEGHIIGHHTLFQADSTGNVSENGVKNDLSTTEQLTQSIIGHQAILVRAPYNANQISPSTLSAKTNEIKTLYAAGKMGYMLVGSNIDSKDIANPGADSIVKNVVKQVSETGSNIVIMHDSGGNRAQTVLALDKLIPTLLSKGYQFVKINELLDVSKDAIMPPVSWRVFVIDKGKELTTLAYDLGGKIFSLLFLFATIISIIRIVFLGIFVMRSRQAEKHHFSITFEPPVTVLVPAYNEEKVIERTVEGLLQSEYPAFEILVIDDGSTDGTADCVRRMMKKYDNVRLISKKNEGKSLALNVGFREVKHEFVLTIDADTIVLPKTIHYLVEPFSSPDVDAVCGNIRVGNVSNILTAFQEVEYVTGQNYDKRAFDALNCITVVPGATGAWRKQKVIDIGGYSSDTLVEDADLTLTLLEQGGKIVYAPLAQSVTEAPEKIQTLFKQRFRWSYGTFQCFWKHRSTFGKGSLGIIALPNMIFSQIVFNILSPLGDILFIFSLLLGNLQMIAMVYFLFFTMDLTATWTAYVLDKTPMTNMWVILIQRFFYRQFMYFVTFKSLLAALRGSHHGWNKLERKGTVMISKVL